MPVPKRGTGCVGTTSAHPSVAVALVDTPQRSGHIAEFAIDGIANRWMVGGMVVVMSGAVPVRTVSVGAVFVGAMLMRAMSMGTAPVSVVPVGLRSMLRVMLLVIGVCWLIGPQGDTAPETDEEC